MGRKLASVAVLLSCSFPSIARAQAQQGEAGRAKLERPPAANLQVAPVPPELTALLKNWSDASAKIEKLQGKHKRYVYDHVFEIEKRAEGVFYYEAPDRGRIDLKPAKIGRGEESKRTNKEGRPWKLQADAEERWICNGQDIWKVDDKAKTIEVFPIPPGNQGANIMDGPLPFLFGMPPDKALRRYKIKIDKTKGKPGQVWLIVHPNWQQDFANWREAEVILDTNHWLPMAVRLIDPAGNLETVYLFNDLEPNKEQPLWSIRSWFGGDADEDVFKPALPGYRRNIVQAQAAAEQPAVGFVPQVVNFRWQDAKSLLERAGYTVRILPGETAPREELVYVVYQQEPQPGVSLKAGETVTLTLYNKPQK